MCMVNRCVERESAKLGNNNKTLTEKKTKCKRSTRLRVYLHSLSRRVVDDRALNADFKITLLENDDRLKSEMSQSGCVNG